MYMSRRIKPFSKLLLIGLLSLILLSVYLITFRGEDMFVLYPEIDTVFADEFSRAGFEKITIGMSTNEVIDLIGQPLSIDFRQKNNGQEEWSYSCDGALGVWGDKAWFYYGIKIKEGRVKNKIMDVFYD